MEKINITTTTTPLLDQGKDSVRESIMQRQVLTKQVINYLRNRSFFVTTIYDKAGRTRILASALPFTQDQFKSPTIMRVKGKFFAIEFGFNSKRERPEQLFVNHQIKRDGGIYTIVRDFAAFLQWLNLNFRG